MAKKIKTAYVLTGDTHLTHADPVEALVRRIQIDPDNTAAWQVYSDYLQIQNDPRGELIALGIVIEKNQKSQEVNEKVKWAQIRFDQILEDNSEAWLGDAAEFIDRVNTLNYFLMKWRYGYLLSVVFTNNHYFEGIEAHQLLATLLKSPIGKFIQQLTISSNPEMKGFKTNLAHCIRELVRSDRRKSIKYLEIGNEFPSDIQAYSHPDSQLLTCCETIISVLPNLEQLIVHCGNIELGKLQSTQLKRLKVEAISLSCTTMESIAQADLPALESLRVWFECGYEDGDKVNMSMLNSLLQGKGYPMLKHLELMNTESGDDIARALVQAPILKQLTSLDISTGTMTDIGAQVILGNIELFAHLEFFDLQDNYISTEMSQCLMRGVKRFSGSISIKDQNNFTTDEER